jgi:hypothetical protein
VRLEQMDVYDPAFQALGDFDFALCLGFLHRIRDLYRFIEVVSGAASSILFEWKAHQSGDPLRPITLYDGRLSLPYDPHSKAYFRPSIGCLAAMLKEHGLGCQSAVDSPVHQRALLFAAAPDGLRLRGRTVTYRRNRRALFYRYTRDYVASLRDLLLNRTSF